MIESSVNELRTGEELCGKWMPGKQTYCARTSGHGGHCKTPEAMESARQRRIAWEQANGGGRKYPEHPEVVRRRNRANNLRRYGLMQECFDLLLVEQEHACGMCRKPFGGQQRICIDHDHNCCPEEKRSCGKCIRGLLCLSCNAALGRIERKYALARAYLDHPPVDWPESHQGLCTAGA